MYLSLYLFVLYLHVDFDHIFTKLRHPVVLCSMEVADVYKHLVALTHSGSPRCNLTPPSSLFSLLPPIHPAATNVLSFSLILLMLALGVAVGASGRDHLYDLLSCGLTYRGILSYPFFLSLFYLLHITFYLFPSFPSFSLLFI